MRRKLASIATLERSIRSILPFLERKWNTSRINLGGPLWGQLCGRRFSGLGQTEDNLTPLSFFENVMLFWSIEEDSRKRQTESNS